MADFFSAFKKDEDDMSDELKAFFENNPPVFKEENLAEISPSLRRELEKFARAQGKGVIEFVNDAVQEAMNTGNHIVEYIRDANGKITGRMDAFRILVGPAGPPDPIRELILNA